MNATPTPREIFRAKGIPHRRMEDWKYTDLRQVLDVETVERGRRFDWELSLLPDAVEQSDIAIDGMPGWATAHFAHHRDASVLDAAARSVVANGVALRIPRDVELAEPIRFEVRSPGQGQVLLLVEQNGSAVFEEIHDADGGGFRNLSVLILLEEGARLTHVKHAAFAPAQVAVETVSVAQARNAQYRMHVLNGGGKLSRTEVNITLDGEGAEADLSGVSVLGDGAHADITTRITHAVPNTSSRQLFKKVAGGKSRAVYQGKITVREGAIQTDSRQTAKALLLSPQAEADLKPELEILADDVKCAHGAAVGDLDADSLFYLRARGIPESEARALLVHAFLDEVVEGIADENLRAEALRFVDEGLARAMGTAA